MTGLGQLQRLQDYLIDQAIGLAGGDAATADPAYLATVEQQQVFDREHFETQTSAIAISR